MRAIGIVLGMIFMAGIAIGQPGMERMRAEKAKYFNEKLEMSDEQSEAFWALYDEYHTMRKDIRIEISQNHLNLRKSNLSDQEARKIIDTEMELKQKMLDLEREYLGKYEKVLSPGQIITLYQAEDDFNKMVMQRLQRNRGQGRGNGPGNGPGGGRGPGNGQGPKGPGLGLHRVPPGL